MMMKTTPHILHMMATATVPSYPRVKTLTDLDRGHYQQRQLLHGKRQRACFVVSTVLVMGSGFIYYRAVNAIVGPLHGNRMIKLFSVDIFFIWIVLLTLHALHATIALIMNIRKKAGRGQVLSRGGINEEHAHVEESERRGVNDKEYPHAELEVLSANVRRFAPFIKGRSLTLETVDTEFDEDADDDAYREEDDPGCAKYESGAVDVDALLECIEGIDDEISSCRPTTASKTNPIPTIDARYMDDASMESAAAIEEICTAFAPNPFRKGFCMNCQKQHAIDKGSGEVSLSRRYRRIDVRAGPSKTAANAALNPLALPENSDVYKALHSEEFQL
jgi:hypothetical protein